MTDDRHDLEAPTSDEKVREALDDAAEAAQRPHDDEQERERRKAGAEEAERQPRRMGEGIHPGSH